MLLMLHQILVLFLVNFEFSVLIMQMLRFVESYLMGWHFNL